MSEVRQKAKIMFVWCLFTQKILFPEHAASYSERDRGSRQASFLQARADFWLFITVLPPSQSVEPHLNGLPSSTNPTQESLLSMALQISSVKTCLHANSLRSQQPHQPIRTLPSQTTALCSAELNIWYAWEQRGGQPGSGQCCRLPGRGSGSVRLEPSWGCELLLSWELAILKVNGDISHVPRKFLDWSSGYSSSATLQTA